jgi:hypothetical protein
MRSILCFDKQKVNRVLSVSLLGTYLDSRADTPTRPLAVASISFFFKKKLVHAFSAGKYQKLSD